MKGVHKVHKISSTRRQKGNPVMSRKDEAVVGCSTEFETTKNAVTNLELVATNIVSICYNLRWITKHR